MLPEARHLETHRSQVSQGHTPAHLHQPERDTQRSTHTYLAIDCRGMHIYMQTHTYVQVTEVYKHTHATPRTCKYTYRGHRCTIFWRG